MALTEQQQRTEEVMGFNKGYVFREHQVDAPVVVTGERVLTADELKIIFNRKNESNEPKGGDEK